MTSTSFSQIQVQSFKIDSLKGDFVVKFTMSPSHSPMNASVGLGPKVVAGFGDFNVMIRFNADGNIDVRNGANFMADSVYPYAAGSKYYVEVKGNTDSAKYSVSIRKQGEDSVLLANNYGFRMNNYTGTLHYFSELINENPAPTDKGVPGSFIGLSDFQIGDFSSLTVDNFNIPIEYSLTGDFGFKFVLTPSHDKMNASAGLSKIPMTGWGDFNAMIQFNPDGNIKVRDSSSFMADSAVPYKGGMKYIFLVWGNTNTSKYNVKVYNENGDTVTLAKNYRFRQNKPGDTLNYVCVKINQNPAEGIPESYVAVDGIEIGTLGFDGSVPALSQTVPVQTGDTTVSFVITPVGSAIDALYAFNELAAVAWGELNAIVRFNPDGNIDARDSAKLES
ncbi:MAG: hypothetical protein HC906_13060 [Bacteroidales bacterium]|nr:hypothetical protein [Bacteroidales bacterium]